MSEISKEEAAREIQTIREQIENTCRDWNREDGIIGLLCLEDAYDDLGNAILYDTTLVESNEKASSAFIVALFRHVGQRFQIVEFAMDFVANLGKKGPRTMQRIPDIEISIASDRLALRDALLSSGKMGPNDALIPGNVRLMGKFLVEWVIRIKECRGTVEETVVIRLLDLMGLFSKLLVYTTAVRLGTSLHKKPDLEGPWINYPPSFTPDWIMAQEGLGPRTLWQSSSSPAEWVSDYGQALEETVPILELGIHSHTVREAMAKEKDEFFRGFNAFPGFAELFSSRYGYSLTDFKTVTDALEKMALPRVHYVYTARYKKMLNDVTAISGLTSQRVKRILESLTWKKGSYTSHFPIIELHSTHAFSLHRIRKETTSRVEGCFLEYDNNRKGLAFENSCRNLLSDHGFIVDPDRLMIDEQVLSDEDSFRIWGRRKVGTDFDVLGSKKNYLLVLECKERKINTSRKTRLRNMFYRYLDELMLKSFWLASNANRLSSSPCSRQPPKDCPHFLLPILVYNFVIDEFGSPEQFLSFKELSHFLTNFSFLNTPTEKDVIDAPVSPARTLSLRCLAIAWGGREPPENDFKRLRDQT